MLNALYREIRYLSQHPWDLSVVLLAPCCILIIFSALFIQGSPKQLPIALIDQDHSQLSHVIEHHLQQNNTLQVITQTEQFDTAQQQLQHTTIWGYVLIPEGAEQRLLHGQDAQIVIAYNQSFFTIGNSISTAMMSSTFQATIEFLKHHHFQQLIPQFKINTFQLKTSVLFNPNLSYELFLEPFLIPALLHLILCCSIAFSVGQEFKFNTTQTWLSGSIYQAILAKSLVHSIIFTFWTILWLIWLTYIQGWFISGHLSILLFGIFFLYLSYALIITAFTILMQDLSRTFGIVAIYAGSSLSFSGVTLPLTNAPLFTKIWSYVIPYPTYARLQTEQWVVGSSGFTSIPHLLWLLVYCLCGYILSYLALKRYLRTLHD